MRPCCKRGYQPFLKDLGRIDFVETVTATKRRAVVNDRAQDQAISTGTGAPRLQDWARTEIILRPLFHRDGQQPNGLRLSCGALLEHSQTDGLHRKTAPPASGAC